MELIKSIDSRLSLTHRSKWAKINLNIITL